MSKGSSSYPIVNGYNKSLILFCSNWRTALAYTIFSELLGKYLETFFVFVKYE